MLASADPGVQTNTVHVYRILAVLFMVGFPNRVFLILDTDSVFSVDSCTCPCGLKELVPVLGLPGSGMCDYFVAKGCIVVVTELWP
jgi:hypothetical protein